MISQRLRSQGILGVAPYLHAGYRCCAACAFAHFYTSFPNWRRGEACAKENNLYGVMIPYGKCLVNYAQGTPISACIGSTSRVIYTTFKLHYMGLQMCPFNVSFERLFYLFPRGFGQANRMRRITHRLTYASYLLPAKITLQLLLSCIVLSAFIS